MKCHVELACWIHTDEEVTKRDLDSLVQTIGVYLTACGGTPKVVYYCQPDMVCITASADEGPTRGKLQDSIYVRKQVLEALEEGGMQIKLAETE